MDQIRNFLHRHPLILIEEEEEDEVVCSGCRKVLSGPIYGCSDCKFYLHKSCTELPREIQNFFHPCPLVLDIESHTCNACFGNIDGFSYRCQRCEFRMHLKCALRPTIKSEGQDIIHHFTHWHPLTLVDQIKDLEVRCHICKKLCSSNSSAYGCKECNFFLHNSCMISIPRQINHFFHPSCPLILLTTPFFSCEGCHEDGSGLAFHCGACDFQLDLKCALLPTVESRGADKIQYYAHQHPLALRESMEFGCKIRCRACREKCLGPCFVCEECDFFLHLPCTVEFPQKIHHPFHPLHPLALSAFSSDSDDDDDTFECSACGGIGDRFMVVYRCAKCDFNLHTDCAKPKLTPFLLKYGGHSHFLTFFDKTRNQFLCDICSKRAQSCFFRCVACEFNIHLYCFPSAPKTIKHKCHLHPLTLTVSPFEFELNTPEDAYNSDDQFYCDVCEEKRYKYESVYYCEECRFIAEIRCVMSEIFPSLTISEDRSTVNGRAISKDEESSMLEATIAKENNEIAGLRAKAKPFETEIVKLRAMLQALEEQLKPIKKRLETLEKDNFLHKYELSHDMKNKYPIEASTSEAQTADLS